ncbi:hypothetical protein [Candidatus Nanohalovita haloferacivicina]|uniref:hypothetical protein n=1 Tax=Candidatus Nanohalovita haloferacivicina TaxID=2978046 RepID=UPI00325FD4F4|nr:hypothetical protein HBNXNv_0830 [Candidatus Nanohalobia archaeon BNXNv]
MGLKQEYGEKVEEVEESVHLITSKKSASRVKTVLDSFLPLVLILLSFVILFQFFNFGPAADTYISYLNYVVILFFAARLGIGLRLAQSNTKFVEDHWLDMLMVIPALSILEELEVGAIFEQQMVGEKATAGIAMARNLGLSAKMTKIIRLVKRTVTF